MNGPYLENHEMEALEGLICHAASDTIGCWISARINGGSALMSCEGNISLTLFKELDRLIMPLVEKAKRNPHQDGLDRVKTTPMPEGQKFPIGARVRIADDLGPYMTHFSGKGCIATVVHTYDHAFGGGDTKSYTLNIDGLGNSSWYLEHQLTLEDK